LEILAWRPDRAACANQPLACSNVTQLRELDKTLVIQDNDKQLAVLLKYEHFEKRAKTKEP